MPMDISIQYVYESVTVDKLRKYTPTQLYQRIAINSSQWRFVKLVANFTGTVYCCPLMTSRQYEIIPNPPKATSAMYRIRRKERDNTMNNRLELSARPGVQHQQLPSISHRSRISRAYPSASRADRSTPARLARWQWRNARWWPSSRDTNHDAASTRRETVNSFAICATQKNSTLCLHCTSLVHVCAMRN